MSRFYDWVRRDTRANQPAAASSNNGMLYWVTNENKLERSSGSAWEAMGLNSNFAASAVAADEAQASNTTWGDLSTVGPVVTMLTGTSVVCDLMAKGRRPGGGGGFTGWIGVGVTGATTLPMVNALIDGGAYGGTMVGSAELHIVRHNMHITGLNAGVNIFTMKYQNDGGGVWNFRHRSLRVIAP